jgi:epoxyqueuosine reductase
MVNSILNRVLQPDEQFIYGFADLRGLLDNEFAAYNFGISIGKKLDDTIVDALEDGPTLEYFNHYKNTNKELAELTAKIHTELTNAGIDSVAIEPTKATGSLEFEKYLKDLKVEVSHKMVATRAGLGWIGKSDLFISKAFGPRIRLVSILLKRNPGNIGTPVEKSRCGTCTLCVDKCPAQAANGKLWNIHVYRDEFFDAHKCRETCAWLTWEKLHVDERICGLCVSVCPIGKK